MSATNRDRYRAIIRKIGRFAAERDWAQFHDPKNLAMAVASEAGELCAELRWVRSESADAHCASGPERDRIVSEIADVGILLSMLADRIGIDLIDAMDAKITSNAKKYPADECRGGLVDRRGER